VTMMLDILLANREAVVRTLGTCEAQLRDLARLVAASDEEGLLADLTAVRDCRRTT